MCRSDSIRNARQGKGKTRQGKGKGKAKVRLRAKVRAKVQKCKGARDMNEGNSELCINRGFGKR